MAGLQSHEGRIMTVIVISCKLIIRRNQCFIGRKRMYGTTTIRERERERASNCYVCLRRLSDIRLPVAQTCTAAEQSIEPSY